MFKDAQRSIVIVIETEQQGAVKSTRVCFLKGGLRCGKAFLMETAGLDLSFIKHRFLHLTHQHTHAHTRTGSRQRSKCLSWSYVVVRSVGCGFLLFHVFHRDSGSSLSEPAPCCRRHVGGSHSAGAPCRACRPETQCSLLCAPGCWPTSPCNYTEATLLP